MNPKLSDFIEHSWLSSLDSAYLESLAQDRASEFFSEDLRAFAKEGALIRSQNLNSSDSKPRDPLSEASYKPSTADFLRSYGYRYAKTNPLTPPPTLPSDISMSENERSHLYKWYCGSMSLECRTLTMEDQRWCQDTYESLPLSEERSPEEQLKIFSRMVATEGFERYLNSRFPGAKRFSLEGLESFNVLLSEIIEQGAQNYGVCDIELGLSHRGRLNVLVNILGKNSLSLFEDFEGQTWNRDFSGDVKYHQGFSSDVIIGAQEVHLSMAFNPSHLEAVGPVIQGSARARQDHWSTKRSCVLPILTHGDSSFCGQGIVMELLNMSQTRGYGVQGTIHIVMDNQIGFTTSNPRDTRSTVLCTDIAKMFDIPVLHINANDPLAMKSAAAFALKWRFTFQKDCILHLIGYRKYGHNEADEPAVTQPLMYQYIRQQESSTTLLEKNLLTRRVLTPEDVLEIKKTYRLRLESGKWLAPWTQNLKANPLYNWTPYRSKPLQDKISTGVERGLLESCGVRIVDRAVKNSLHPRVAKIYSDRLRMYTGQSPLDWGAAEALSFATLTTQGRSVRLSGQDSKRGTFFQRHCYVIDQFTGESVNTIDGAAGSFYAVDSLLSESAVLGFEYGYASTNPDTLVLWEAQFGDFANGAQVMIDQFLAAGQQKWGQYCGLVLLLPHGYEGQGPEHSSARIERYLQLAAQNNMKITYPSTPGQYFHLLRAQICEECRYPLIVFTPKSLLRHPLSVSLLEECTRGNFQKVILDEKPSEKINRIILCSGKIYFELKAHQELYKKTDTLLVRVEQFYPFPHDELESLAKTYSLVQDFRWTQEEPMNQGAWAFIAPKISAFLNTTQKLIYCGRKESGSTATGWHSQHETEQADLVEQAFASLTF